MASGAVRADAPFPSRKRRRSFLERAVRFGLLAPAEVVCAGRSR